MFYKEFDVRWSDLDANRHLANASYLNYMSHTRMAFLESNGFSHKELKNHNIGPVIFYEHIYYFKEIFPGKPIKVTLEIRGLSDDGMFFEFVHNFYDQNGKNLSHCEMFGAWINLETRQLTALPQNLVDILNGLEHTYDFKKLTKEDARRFGKKPIDMVLDK